MNTSQNSENQAFALVEGAFTSEEAREIILDLLVSKISFHTLRNFSSEIRFNKSDTRSKQRIQELEKAQAEVLEILKVGKDEIFQINCKIELQVIKGNDAAQPNSAARETVV